MVELLGAVRVAAVAVDAGIVALLEGEQKKVIPTLSSPPSGTYNAKGQHALCRVDAVDLEEFASAAAAAHQQGLAG